MSGEALMALLESKQGASDTLIDLLPKSVPMGQKLIFTRRISEQFQHEVKKPGEPSHPPLGFKRRFFPFLILAYAAWEVCSILSQRYAQHQEHVLEQQSDTIGHMYSWLGWGPVPGTTCYQSMHKYFAGSLPSRAVVERVEEALRPFSMTTQNTIYAEATCSDEINHEPRRLGAMFTDVWGSVFPMGGIGGFPYGGQAALGAFSGHVPDGGNMFLLYGPHVGVSESGEVGVVLRTGQTHCTTACGALMGIYKNCLNGVTPGNYSDLDAQARFIHEALDERLEEISGAESPEAMLPRVAFDVAHEQVMEMTKNMKLGSGYLVMLGGIQINTPDNMQDQFLPMHFSIQSKYMPRKDLTQFFDTQNLHKATYDFLAKNLAKRHLELP